MKSQFSPEAPPPRRPVSRFSVVLPITAVVLLAPQTGRAQDMSNAIHEHVRKSTVMVKMEIPGTSGVGFGTGEFLNSTGLLMTNNHVVDPHHGETAEEWQESSHHLTLPKYHVIVESGTPDEVVYEAEVLHQTEAGDMAIVQLKDKDGKKPRTPHHVRFLPSEDLREGQKIWIFGFPGGLMRGKEVAVTAGLITDLKRTASGAINYIETDATAHPGNSGGPMVDVDGRLVGLLTHGLYKEGEKNTTGAVPVLLVKQFLRAAFAEGRIPREIDVLPFIEVFTNQNGIVEIPTYPRKPNECFVFYANGTTRAGALETATILADTTLGNFELPLDHAAYVFVDGEAATFVMDGGDMLRCPTQGKSLNVKFESKSETIPLNRVEAVAFALREKPVRYATGKGTWLDADGSRMALSDIEGKVSFAGSSYAVDELVAIEAGRGQEKTIRTTGGERIRGAFTTATSTAMTPWAKDPLTIDLSGIQHATAHPVNWAYINADGRRLSDRLELADDDLKQIADLLESPDWEKARPMLEQASSVRRSGDARKQFELLTGIEEMRAGKYDDAMETFKHNRSKRSEVGWVAEAYMDVLEQYPDKTYYGASLSDPDAVWRASTDTAMKLIADVDERMAKLDSMDYLKQVKELDDLEEELDAANRLRLGVAQGKLVELLKVALDLHVAGYNSLVAEYNETVDRANREHVRSAQVKWERKLRAIDSRLKKCQAEAQRVYDRIGQESAGFRLPPPKFDRKK